MEESERARWKIRFTRPALSLAIFMAIMRSSSAETESSAKLPHRSSDTTPAARPCFKKNMAAVNHWDKKGGKVGKVELVESCHLKKGLASPQHVERDRKGSDVGRKEQKKKMKKEEGEDRELLADSPSSEHPGLSSHSGMKKGRLEAREGVMIVGGSRAEGSSSGGGKQEQTKLKSEGAGALGKASGPSEILGSTDDAKKQKGVKRKRKDKDEIAAAIGSLDREVNEETSAFSSFFDSVKRSRSEVILQGKGRSDAMDRHDQPQGGACGERQSKGGKGRTHDVSSGNDQPGKREWGNRDGLGGKAEVHGASRRKDQDFSHTLGMKNGDTTGSRASPTGSGRHALVSSAFGDCQGGAGVHSSRVGQGNEHGYNGGKKKGTIPWHPFQADYGDHFETGDAAYGDIAPLLERLAHHMGIRKEKLSIYDPYYCAGGVISRLRSLGFPDIYNRNEDCYKVWREKKTPKHNVLVTNPPFSGDHKEKCMKQCVESGRPWAVILPNYCATKQYFQRIVEPCKEGLFFGVPKKMYEFEHPEGTGHQKSPFFSLWFVCFGSYSGAIVDWYNTEYGGKGGLHLCMSVHELGEKNAVRVEKRLSAKRRKKLKMKKTAS